MKFSPVLKFVSFNVGTIGCLMAGTALAENNFEPISNYNSVSIFAQIGLPVGKLNIKTDHGSLTCTAFLISEKHLITNAHCVSKSGYLGQKDSTTIRTIEQVDLKLGYIDLENKKSEASYKVKLPPIEINNYLDYAVLEVEGNPSFKYGILSISIVEPMANMPLWIVGHPGGRVQQISRTDCKSIIPLLHKDKAVRHTCGSMGGSSGSPVIDATTKQVIALHYGGFPNSDVGVATPFSFIVPQSPILQSILNDH